MLPTVTPWFGISHYDIVVDDMIIINVDYISTKDGRSRLSRPDALFHSSHLGLEFRVLCLLASVPNLVWDAMGSPLLTYLASNISSGGPSRFTICKPCIYVCRVAPSRYLLKQLGPAETWFLLLVHPIS